MNSLHSGEHIDKWSVRQPAFAIHLKIIERENSD